MVWKEMSFCQGVCDPRPIRFSRVLLCFITREPSNAAHNVFALEVET